MPRTQQIGKIGASNRTASLGRPGVEEERGRGVRGVMHALVGRILEISFQPAIVTSPRLIEVGGL